MASNYTIQTSHYKMKLSEMHHIYYNLLFIFIYVQKYIEMYCIKLNI